MRFGFCGPTYQSLSPNAAAERSINLFPERIEGDQGKGSYALYYTPGLSVFASIAGQKNRGQHVINGRLFTVVDGTLYEVFVDGSKTSRGNIANDGNPVSMASSEIHLLVVSAGLVYLLVLSTSVLTALSPALFAGQVASCFYVDSYFGVIIKNSKTFQFSNLLDGTTWLGTSTGSVSVFADNIAAAIVDHRELWICGLKESVGYYNSGNLFPFDVIPNSFVEQGGNGPGSAIVKLDNSVMFLSSDEDRGGLIAYRLDGYRPNRISNHSVENFWRNYTVNNDAIGYSYVDGGHTFWVIYFPTASATWVYDAATGMWHERGYWNAAQGVYTAHRSWNHVFVFGKHLVGDWASGNIYQMSTLIFNDFGNPIRRLRQSPHVVLEGEFVHYEEIRIDVEAGLASIKAPSIYSQSLVLADTNGVLWSTTINDAGTIATVAAPGGSVAQTVILNDSGAGTTSWKLTVSIGGVLGATSSPFGRQYPQVWPLASSGTILNTGLTVTAGGVPQSIAPNQNFIGAGIMLSWSNDGTKTFSNEYRLDCGMLGQYLARAIKRRLGRARTRTFKVVMTDSAPWNIIDAYLRTDVDQEPQKRLAHKFRETA